MKREPVAELLGQTLQNYSIGPSKRSPKQLFFYQPQMAKLPSEKHHINGEIIQIQQSIKVFNIGAISILIRVPFQVEKIEDLVDYHEPKFTQGSIEELARQLAEKARHELEPYCVQPVQYLSQVENYTVFCLHELPDNEDLASFQAEEWLETNRREVAGLLTEEANTTYLSEQEATESTGQYLTYYRHDLVVVDWDAALIVGEKEGLDDILHIMEVANVQLVELSAYDRLLDESLEKAYRDLAKRRVKVSREIHRNLREIRVDLARFSDELSNITKFFGDWHLARIYTSLSNRFHLADWYRVIREKLRALGDLYQLLQQDWVNFWMVLLEATIVLLFILDVILLLVGL
jgi:tRNA isopentenyl-2-thiomethyl-A-37 hydroxylase MiaE